MKSISSLVEDIYKTLKNPVAEVNEAEIGREFGELFRQRIGPDDEVKDTTVAQDRKGVVRASNIGTPCNRQLWYKINMPDAGEELAGHTLFKFFYGHMVESAALTLAELSGHSVTGKQDSLSLGPVQGHRDAVIDGITVDVKTTSYIRKFQEGLTEENDSFGYLAQLGFYLAAAREAKDPLVTDYNTGAFLVVDKTNGHFHVAIHKFSDSDLDNIVEMVYNKVELVQKDQPPNRTFSDIPDGKSGNRKLGVECSYCAFKHICWPGLQVVANKQPKFLTKVVSEPKNPVSEYPPPLSKK